MDRKSLTLRSEIARAKSVWGEIGKVKCKTLRLLIERHQLSVVLGDILYIDERWYVSHSGLLRIAHRNRCAGITSSLVARQSDASMGHWVFRATVYKTPRSRGFVGYGDADPSNVSPLVRGAEMRVAETRAVNRALRKAYGIGLCSVEELGWCPIAAGSAVRASPIQMVAMETVFATTSRGCAIASAS